jgi:hypothetical protein
MCTVPAEKQAFGDWIYGEDSPAFFHRNEESADIVMHVMSDHMHVHGVLIPTQR